MGSDEAGDAVLQPIPVDLEQLAETLEGDPMSSGGILDLDTGAVWPDVVLDGLSGAEREQVEDAVLNRLVIDNLGSRAAFGDMRAFAATLSDERLAERLEAALRGRGAFRRFGNVLAGRSHDLLHEYLEYARTRKMERAAEWLADRGYIAVDRGGSGSPDDR